MNATDNFIRIQMKMIMFLLYRGIFTSFSDSGLLEGGQRLWESSQEVHQRI